ncbi:ABC transporter permease subunit [Rhodobacter capsulatus]|uniref:ABC transporter permease n=1 Tax=Rhodobacter capsulatus TaxID=1061 RepID=UPI0006DCDCC6|nr:ABC transporter permease subunit [Rhodobacter capsulatus]KQB15549.1 ABC transporter permease [Rhodobacter capsulatus]KQB16307.1 ABC transporter permease [Rhodobacter capsulatus]PZX28296.1 polar amino acid transport system permease protein [Rhodobacter capsulatus]QNR62586.1 ABC transporter permease subunit [Rhodobacter capsulatus]
MFDICADPKSLEGLAWALCYLTTGKHLLFYGSFFVVLALMLIVAPIALAFGFGGAIAARSAFLPLRLFGKAYTAMVRGVPDIIFFLFVPVAMDQGLEYLRHLWLCPPSDAPLWSKGEFAVCAAAKLPLSSAPQIWHEIYGFFLAVIAFSVVFGAFAANVLYGAMNAVPRAQLETAEAYGMTTAQVRRRILIPQMWTYALPGLSNLWMILIKATPLLFLLGVEDIVYWARELGATKSALYDYPHGDWRVWYVLALLVYYLGMTKISERVLDRVTSRLSKGQATMAGEAQRKAAA